MKIEIDTKVKYNRFGVGKVVNYLPSKDMYLVYFPFETHLHNGRLINEGLMGYDTNQYWWCQPSGLTVISEDEYKKELGVLGMNIEELMNEFKVGDTIVFRGNYNDAQGIAYYARDAKLLRVVDYYTDTNKVEVQVVCDSNTYRIGDTTKFDIMELKHFKHHELKCSCCDKQITTEAIVIKDDTILCKECLDKKLDNEEIVKCECCNEYVEYDDSTHIYNLDKTVCNECYDDNYRECRCCGDIRHVDDMMWSEDYGDWYCSGCYPSGSSFDELYNNLIPLENGKRYFGMELEVENFGNYDYDISEQINNILGTDVLLEIKEDSSLDSGGFEIVFQPLSEEYINSDVFRDKLTRLRQLLQDNNFYEEAPNGGIHIHTTRLGGEDIADLYTLARFFEPELTKINARFNDGWCKIGGYTTDYAKNKELNKEIQGETRYQWWNTTNSRTIECRAFDSTLNVDTILSAYNFVINAFKYRCDKKVNNVSWDMLMGKPAHITKTTKVYSVDTLRFIKQMYKSKNGKIRAIKHIMSLIEKEVRFQLDISNYSRVATLSNELKYFNDVVSNSCILKDYSLDDIARRSKNLNIEEVNEYIRHL